MKRKDFIRLLGLSLSSWPLLTKLIVSKDVCPVCKIEMPCPMDPEFTAEITKYNAAEVFNSFADHHNQLTQHRQSFALGGTVKDSNEVYFKLSTGHHRAAVMGPQWTLNHLIG